MDQLAMKIRYVEVCSAIIKSLLSPLDIFLGYTSWCSCYIASDFPAL
jgi:hypothetical protein